MAFVQTDPDRRPACCTIFFGLSSFLGRSLVSALLSSAHWTLRIADLLSPPDPICPDSDQDIDFFHVDVADRSSILSAVDGSEVVFLIDPVAGATAASPEAGEDFLRLHAFAVVGTKNILAACRESAVRRLVYTGSADVVFDGRNDIRQGNELFPYPDKFEDVLNELRMQVEILVLGANGKDGLLTCALRPSNVFGPGDPNFVPFLVRETRSGRAKFVIGSGKNMCDFTYVENVVHANISAECALRSEPASVSGKPFFITNNEPAELWKFISSILEGLGYPRPTIHLPVKIVSLVVRLAKLAGKKLGFCKMPNSIFSHTNIYAFSCTRTFDCSNAKTLIGYSPTVPIEDGIELTVESFSHLAKGSSDSRERDLNVTSKADKLLGSGVVADLLLWRDEKRTFAYLFILFLLFYLFFLSGRTFVASSAKALLVITAALFVHGILPTSMFGLSFEKISSSYFETSESNVRHVFLSLASVWNKGVSAVKLLALGDDWGTFFKVAGFLYLVKMLLHIPISLLFGFGLTCLFSIFIVYEQCEEEVDKLKTVAALGLGNVKEQLIARLPETLMANVSKSKKDGSE